ncbi:MAG TPA: MtrB/PioB family outer membrane beta-barrel protein [Vicinamibacteria bacterium]|nr:MtrB/PioB family outer membrane beta-barrel protein [Vicinamibacteria bacterium]
MKPATLLAVLLLAAPALAQEAPATGDFTSGSLSLGGSAVDLNVDSSKFQEYRDVPDGVAGPGLHLFGRRGELDFDLRGDFVRPESQAYNLKADWRDVRVKADFLRLPHRFGNDGRSWLDEVSPGVYRANADFRDHCATALTNQFAANRTAINFGFLNGLVSAHGGAPYAYDVQLLRERGRVDVDLARGKPVDVTFSYARDRRDGNRPFGTSFGFGNVVETPEPIDFLTQDVSARAELTRSWGVVRGILRYNWFDNRITSVTFETPFRLVDSTHASAYSAPSSTTVDGAAVGRLALAPSNDSVSGSVGGVFKLPRRTRFTADVTVGRWTQNETPFLPYSTNTAITGIDEVTHATFPVTAVSSLPATRLDGKADVLSMSYNLTSRPVDNLTLTARYRSYDLDNKTPSIEFPGYVRFEAVWEEIPRRSVPYSFKTDRLEGTMAYDFGRFGLEAGYRRSAFHRTFRETEETVENAALVSARLRASDWLMVRGSFERARRDFDQFHLAESEHASYLDGGDPVNLLAVDPTTLQSNGQALCPAGTVCNIRFDQARRTFDKVSGLAQVTPHDKVAFSLSYLLARSDYDESLFGLTFANYETFGADVDYAPTDRVGLYAYYSREKNRTDQRGRQSGATVSNRAIDDWTADVRDVADTFGGGANLTLVPEKWFLNLSGRYQEVDGDNAIFTDLTGLAGTSRAAAGGAAGLPNFDDTKLWTLNAEVKYQPRKAWAVAAGAWHEEYVYRDDTSVPRTFQGNVVNYFPGTFFLNALDGNYKATVAYLKLMYAF